MKRIIIIAGTVVTMLSLTVILATTSITITKIDDNVSAEIKCVEADTNVTIEQKVVSEMTDVVITDIDCTWRDNKAAYYKIEYESEDHGIIETKSNISNWSDFGNDLERRKIQEGDILKAWLYSTVNVTGDKVEVVSRRLGELVD